MIGRLKQFAKTALATPPILGAFRKLNVKADTVAVLCYHTLGRDDGNIDAWTVLRQSDFFRQIAEVKKHFDIVSLDDAISTGAAISGKPRAVLTFDDGDVGLFNYLLPFVEKERIPATVYVATSQIVDGVPFWFDRIMNALQTDNDEHVDLTNHGLGVWDLPAAPGAPRWLVISDILEALKTASPDIRDAAADEITDMTKSRLKSNFERLAPMSVEQLTALSASEWITIGSHSHCHSLLDQIPVDQLRFSAAKSRTLLEEWTAQPIRHFAYPNGNHSAQVRDTIRQMGCDSATALDNKLWKSDADLYEMSRIAVGRYDSLNRFKLRLTGV